MRKIPQRKIYSVRGVRATAALAARIARAARGGDVLALSGPLGAGKTTFVQAFAKALGVRQHLTSPTFVLMRVYSMKHRASGIEQRASSIEHLVHVDAYRVRDAQELADIGLLDYLGEFDTVTLVEWAERVKKILLKNGVQWIRIRLGKSPNERVFVLS